MTEAQILGYIVTAVITLGGFVAVIMKFVQPINDLRVVIQKLNDNIDSMKAEDKTRDKRLDRHGEELDQHTRQLNALDNRVGKIETRVDAYHKHN